MTALIAGLVVFLGVHSTRIFADDWRTRQVAQMGLQKWKLLYTVVSLLGFALLVWGYGQARMAPVVVWNPPVWTRHAASLLLLPSFILIVAGNMRGTRIKHWVGHPMVAGVKVWAFAHLLANGTLADIVLFGSFLAWAIVDYISSRRRDRVAGIVYPPGSAGRDAVAIVGCIVAWAVFGFWLHGYLIGVRPFG